MISNSTVFYKAIVLRQLTLVFLILLGCVSQAFAKDNNQNQAKIFQQILPYAKLSNAVYQDISLVKKVANQYEYRIIDSNNIPGLEVFYVLLQHRSIKNYLLVVRGTANLENALLDLAIQLKPDDKMKILLHEGFSSAANAIFSKIEPLINREYSVTTTGHSLGGAVALIVGMLLDQAGHDIFSVTTFGQPKVTNFSGAQRFSHLPVLRVVTESDYVPLVPPIDPRDLKKITVYWHLGEEILLKEGRRFSQLSELDSMLRATNVLSIRPGEENINSHKADYYVKLTNQKIQYAEKIPNKNKLLEFIGNQFFE